MALPIDITLGSNVKSINSIKLLTAEEVLERVLMGVKSQLLKEELMRWYFFGLDGAGKGVGRLSVEELGEFMDRLPDIVLVLYSDHQD